MNPIQIDDLNCFSGTDYEHLYTKLLFNTMIIDSDALKFNSSRQITGVMTLLSQELIDKPANIHFKVSDPQNCLLKDRQWKCFNDHFKFQKQKMAPENFIKKGSYMKSEEYN